MIYDREAKQAYCKRNGAPWESVALLPYEQWTALRFREALQRREAWAINQESSG
jgi:hypothetical protein